MTLTPELFFLTLVVLATALMWVPYVVARVLGQGLGRTLANPAASNPPLPAWAQRARQAHANAIENLAVFAPLVLVAHAVGAGSPATVFAAQLYLGARLAHYVVYAAGIPGVRTLAFLCGSAATLVFAWVLLARV
ncbi:MAPEG family protein [Variovorax sp. RCC_210]|uniref:MAPEG family protein n=1 Tax=Variovorax sp. RCC_210 TaxID=3239217 RepID=UPI003523DC15